MPLTGPLINVDRAQVARADGGAVDITDPRSPWLVRVWPATVNGRHTIGRIEVVATDPTVPITAARLGRLPTAQMLHVAAAEALGTGHGAERYYRLLATPKPAGARSWDDGHWQRVLAVFAWARSTGRPGGGARAVADMWGVAVDPTVRRWLARARHRSR